VPQRLLNRYEEITFHRVKEVTDRVGAHVFPKVRIADVLPINGSGISGEDFSFCLKAHFDFVVTDAGKNPLFAVEFDGPTHRDAEQTARDGTKDKVAARFGLPLLRINANYVDKNFRDLDLLTYFIEVWFLREAFFEAQAGGRIPWDEPFDPASVMMDGIRDRKWPFWLSVDARIKIEKLFEDKLVETRGANYWVGTDAAKRYRCLAWIGLPGGSACFVETGMQSQNFPVREGDVLEQIAVIDLHEALDKIARGELKPQAAASLKEKAALYTGTYELCSSGTWATPG